MAANRRNYEDYRAGLAGIPGVELIAYDDAERCNYQYVVLEVDESAPACRATSCCDVLWAENVLARRYFFPGCHRMEPYRSLFPDAGDAAPADRTARASACWRCRPGTAVDSRGRRDRGRPGAPGHGRGFATAPRAIGTRAPCVISVLITSYQHERYIARALDGVLEQRGVEYEVLVGDDASTDGTRRVIAEYASSHPALIRTFLPERNLGQGGKAIFSVLVGWHAASTWRCWMATTTGHPPTN